MVDNKKTSSPAIGCIKNTLQQISLLVGKWNGTGVGQFPTMEPFRYLEHLEFFANGEEPLLHYEQKTWRLRSVDGSKGEALHWESGFFRVLEDGSVDISNAQNGGRVEVLNGTLLPKQGGFHLSLNSIVLAHDPRMAKTKRTYTLQDEKTLLYLLEMETIQVAPIQQHLKAILHKAS